MSRESAGDAFVGRDAELSRLDDLLAHAAQGRPSVQVMVGAPGIGKTTCLRRWLDALVDIRYVWVSGDEDETRLPYGVLHQLQRRLAGPGIDPLAPDADPLVAGALLLDQLGEAFSGAEPLVVVIDDAQWADRPSMRALTFVARRLVAERAMLLACTRATSDLPDGLVRLTDTSAGTLLRLEGLSIDETRQLARRHAGLDLNVTAATRLQEHTAGNPLHALALLNELSPDTWRQPAGPLPAPRSYALLVLARLHSCTPETAELVTAAAVLGQRCRLADAASLGGVAHPADALQEAAQAGMLESAGTDLIAFPHGLVRAAIYHHLGPPRRSQLHRAAAELDGVDARSAALDHRIAAALVPDATLAAEVRVGAEAEAASGQVSLAVGHFLDAARLSEQTEHQQAATLEAVTLLLLSGQVREAAPLADSARRFAPSGSRSFVLGLLAFFQGRQQEAEQWLTDAWERREGSSRTMATMASGFLAQLCSIQVRGQDTMRWARRSIEVSGDPYVAPAFSVLVCNLGFAGRSAEAFGQVELSDRKLALLSRESAAELLAVRGILRLWHDNAEGARESLSGCVDLCRPALASRTGIIGLGYLAESEFRCGDWDASIGHAGLAVSLSEDAELEWTAAFIHSMAALPLALRGDWAQAEKHTRTAEAASAGLRDIASVAHAAMARMLLEWCRGRPEDIVAAAAPLVAAEHRASLEHPGCHYQWQALRADALVSLDRHDEAAAVIAELLERAVHFRLRIPQAQGLRVLGRMHAARRSPTEASAAFERGRVLLEDVVAPFEIAQLALAEGQFLRRMGKRRLAGERLTEASGHLLRLRAAPLIELCDRELAGCGLRPSPRTVEVGPSRLSPQELSVARRVAAGKTNREVAAEIVVSTKTVEYHLGNVFRKLGLRSRVELVRRFDRLEAVDEARPSTGQD